MTEQFQTEKNSVYLSSGSETVRNRNIYLEMKDKTHKMCKAPFLQVNMPTSDTSDKEVKELSKN